MFTVKVLWEFFCRWEIAPTEVNAYYEPLYNQFGKHVKYSKIDHGSVTHTCICGTRTVYM